MSFIITQSSFYKANKAGIEDDQAVIMGDRVNLEFNNEY